MKFVASSTENQNQKSKNLRERPYFSDKRVYNL